VYSSQQQLSVTAMETHMQYGSHSVIFHLVGGVNPAFTPQPK